MAPSPGWRDDSSDDPSSADGSSSSAVTSADASPAGSPLGSGAARFRLRINLSSCKYPVLRVVQRQLGWVEVGDGAYADLHWTDTSAGCERLVGLRRPQKLNHLPGMLEIARKKGLARNLGAMRALFPAAYDFAPPAFLLPEMAEAFAAELAANRGKTKKITYILKLDNGSMGRGIKLVQTPAQAAAALPSFEHDNVVACQYLANPLLIGGLKFDLRIYVLVRCCAPLRLFLCREGLVRFCTERYAPPAPENLDHVYAHLTNYAVNKHNPGFVFNQDAQQAGTGSKWTISALAEWMRGQGHDFDALWSQIKQMVCKTLISIQPMLQYQYACATRPDDAGLTCFELLGLDVLIDDTQRPWLLEVNHSPSLSTDTPLDLELKSRLIREALELAGVQPEALQAELVARQRAKQQRLYSGHAASQAHSPSAAAAPAARGASSAAAAASGTDPTTPTAGPLPREAEPAADASPPGGVLPGAQPAAAEPERGSAEWLAAQAAYEDAHLGQFERIMPPEDPALAAHYEELLQGALQVFYRCTMQGRNQQLLNSIKERRRQEASEEAARQEAQQRRAEQLRAWMAEVCQKHREERQLRAAAQAAAADASDSGSSATVAAGAGGWAADGAAADGAAAHAAASASGRTWSDADSDGTDTERVLQQRFFAARQFLPTPPPRAAAGASALASRQPGWRFGNAGRHAAAAGSSGGPGGRDGAGSLGASLCVTGVPMAAPAYADSARTSASGAAQPASCTDGSSSGGGGGGGGGSGRTPRRPLSAGPLQNKPVPVTVESVIERLAAARSATEQSSLGSQGLMLPPGYAALAAWQAASGQHSAAAEQSWQQAAWDAYGCAPGARPPSSPFLDRVATFTLGLPGASAAAAADLAQAELGGLRLSRGGSCSDHTAAGPAAGCGLGSSRGVATPDLGRVGNPLAATYIPPAMLSALHTVRMSPRLLTGLRSPPAQQAVEQRRRGKKQAAAGNSAGGGGGWTIGAGVGGSSPQAAVGQAAIGLPPAGPAAGAKPHPTPGKGQRGAGAAAHGGPANESAAVRGSGRPGASKQQYVDAIQRQAVQSVAALIADLMPAAEPRERRRRRGSAGQPGGAGRRGRRPPPLAGPKQEGGRTFYSALEAPDGLKYELGDDVYLRPAEPGRPPFVARLESLHQETPAAEGGSSGGGGGGASGGMVAGVRWFYRPEELDVPHELAIEQNEIFFSNDYAPHDISALCGKCVVLTPAQADRRPGASAAEPGPGTFVCSRKYLPAEGRVVPIGDGVQGVTLAAALQEKPFAVVGSRVVQRGPTAADLQARPKRVRGGAPAAPAAEQKPQPRGGSPTKPLLDPLLDQPPQPPAKKRRHERERGRSREPSAGAPGAAAAGAAAGTRSRDGSVGSDQRRSTSTHSGASGGEGGEGARRGGRAGAKPAKETLGRWSKERYENAQRGLVGVLRGLGGTAADRAVPRPALREAARKGIGDTGLLDHLLKHMADQAVNQEGERLRRRHDAEGHMVYWLQSPAEAAHKEQLLRGEVEALSSELRQVQEARRVLSAVRGPAIQAVSTLKSEEPSMSLSGGGTGAAATPASGPTPTASPAPDAGAGAAAAAANALAAAGLGMTGLGALPGAGDDLMQRVQAAEGQAQAVLTRLQDAESLALAGLEAARGEAAETARLLGGQLSTQLAALADVARLVNARCTTLEHQLAALAEEGQGRYEALVAALTANAGLRAEVAANQARISGLGEQVEALRRDVAALAGTAAAGQPPAGAGSASQGARPVGPERQPATPLNAGPEKQGQAVPVASVPLVPSAPAAATRPAALPLQPGLAGLAVPGMPQALLLQRAPGQPPAANLMPGPLLMSALLQQHMQAASRPSASWPSGPATTGPLPPPFVPSGAAPPSVPLADKKAGAGTGASASAAKK